MRHKAISKLLDECDKWSEDYNSDDFFLDGVIRTLLGIKEKKLGHPPYEDWV
jgi:hypothetical protein